MNYQVYIAGPMSGHENYNFDTFNEVADEIEHFGLPGDVYPVEFIQVVNPAKNFSGDQTRQRREYLSLATKQARAADGIVLLPGWADSEGAVLEATIGLDTGADFFTATLSPQGRWHIYPMTGEIIKAILETTWDRKHPGAEPAPEIDDNDYEHYELPLLDPCPACNGCGSKVQPERLVQPSDPVGSDVYDPHGVLRQWEQELRTPELIEHEAGRLVREGARQQTYGHPRGDFDRVAGMWAALLGVPVTAEQVAVMMIAFKLARLSKTPQHRDTKVDVIGYTICLDRLDEPQESAPVPDFFISATPDDALRWLQTNKDYVEEEDAA